MVSEKLHEDLDKTASPGADNSSQSLENGAPTHAAPEPTADDSPPKEDVFAWMQVVGAFCLNLNTWYDTQHVHQVRRNVEQSALGHPANPSL